MSNLDEVIQTVHRLRAPGGCPWDREQTHQSLRKFLIEEAFEAVDALDAIDSPEDLKDPRKRDALIEELGDVLLQVLLHSEIASETGAFNIQDVAHRLNRKLIQRHPHVFGDQKVAGSAEVLENWKKLKEREKSTAESVEASTLDSIPRSLPTLARTVKILEKATQVGFQWKDTQGPLNKVEEELEEAEKEIAHYDFTTDDEEKAAIRARIADEIGDLLFSICNLAHVMKIDPDDALRSTLRRFDSRFRFVEKSIRSTGRKMEEATLEEMDQWWNKAKEIESRNDASD